MNNINLTGRLTYDPELKETNNGTKFTRFKLAVSRIGAQEGQQKADFIPCLAWSKTAEILCQYCKKGSMIGLNGRLTANEYEKDGEKKIAFDVVALSLEMLGGKSEKQEESKPQAEPVKAPNKPIEAGIDDYIDDNVNLPFEI